MGKRVFVITIVAVFIGVAFAFFNTTGAVEAHVETPMAPEGGEEHPDIPVNDNIWFSPDDDGDCYNLNDNVPGDFLKPDDILGDFGLPNPLRYICWGRGNGGNSEIPGEYVFNEDTGEWIFVPEPGRQERLENRMLLSQHYKNAAGDDRILHQSKNRSFAIWDGKLYIPEVVEIFGDKYYILDMPATGSWILLEGGLPEDYDIKNFKEEDRFPLFDRMVIDGDLVVHSDSVYLTYAMAKVNELGNVVFTLLPGTNRSDAALWIIEDYFGYASGTGTSEAWNIAFEWANQLKQDGPGLELPELPAE